MNAKRLFDDLMTWQPPHADLVWSAFASPVTVQNTVDGTTVMADMPGVAEGDIEVTFERGFLTLIGKRQNGRSYNFKLQLGDTIDPDKIEAHLDKGVLVVVARKKEEAKPRKIPLGATSKAIVTQ